MTFTNACLFPSNGVKFNFMIVKYQSFVFASSLISCTSPNHFFFWLHWVFVAACRLSLAAASGGFSCCGARALGAWAAVVAALGLSSCCAWALERRPSSCLAWA